MIPQRQETTGRGPATGMPAGARNSSFFFGTRNSQSSATPASWAREHDTQPSNTTAAWERRRLITPLMRDNATARPMHRTRMPLASHVRRSRRMPSPHTHSTARGGAREPQAFPPPCQPHVPPRAAADISLGPTGLPAGHASAASPCTCCWTSTISQHTHSTTCHTPAHGCSEVGTLRPRILQQSWIRPDPLRPSWSCVGQDRHPAPGLPGSLSACLAIAYHRLCLSSLAGPPFIAIHSLLPPVAAAAPER